MNNNFLSSFTPSLMSSETLEAIFVQRHKLVEDLIESVRHSAETANKHFRLLIGMRGIGKTHTIALIYHRLKKIEELQDNLLIAWLKEEEWGVNFWLDLLIRIFQALAFEYPESYETKLKQDVEFIYEFSAEEATRYAERILREFIGDKTLLLLAENLDEIFNGLGDSGQKQFRAYLQNNNLITIIATSQSLFNGVSNKDAPFYGFFNPKYLDKLTIEEATNLLSKIAQRQQDKELESFIQSSMGKDRIKAIHHLAGGNHRVYIIFSQFLTRNALDELVKPVMQTLDELTPYYQARMQSLSPQQRKIIELLCDKSNALPVKEIAQRCFISHQTASSQLKDLRKKGYVIAESIGRESFYELQEPLMRICLEVKKQRGEPIKLFIDFLRIWYTKEELLERYLSLPEEAKIEKQYIKQAMNISLTDEQISEKLYLFIQEKILDMDSEKLFEILNQKNIDDDIWLYTGDTFYESGNYETALKVCNLALKNNSDNIEILRIKAQTLFELEYNEENLYIHNRLINLTPLDSKVWNNKGVILGRMGKYPEELRAYDEALKLEPTDINALRNKALSLYKLEQYEQAIEVFNQVIQHYPKDAMSWSDKSRALLNIGKHDEALESVNYAISLDSKYINSWINKGIICYKMKLYEESLMAFEEAIKLDKDNLEAMILIIYTLEKLKKYDEALEYCNILFIHDSNNITAWSSKFNIQIELNQYKEALISSEKMIQIQPQNAVSWLSKGIALYYLENYYQSIESFDKAIEINPNFSSAFLAKTEAILKLNNWEEGFKKLDDALNRFANKKEESHIGDTSEYIKIIWDSTRDINVWKSRIKTLVKIYDKHQVISVLSKGIVDHIPKLMSEMVSNKLARTWLEIWQSIVGNKPELSIALRFLKTAVEYKETKGDRRILLQLAKEEREILEPLVKLQ